MTTFKHILFPVDFSQRCIDSGPMVMSVARQFHARITLLNIVQIPDAWYARMDGAYPFLPDTQELLDAARARLDTFLESNDPALTICSAADQGDPG